MANSPDFVAHAVELLSCVERVEARAMFGGHGVYACGVMFGLLDDDELFLKTDEVSRPRFVEAGCRRWVYVGPTQKMENTSYFRPPDGAHEDPEAMLPWARLALDSALRLAAARTRRAARPKEPRPARAPKPAPRAAKEEEKAPARAKGGAKARKAPARRTSRRGARR